MQTTNLIQGSPEWLAHRRSHFNASDAPAMMGCSPYKTRTQLLHEMHTGIASEVDPVTQRRFNDGHRFEALARPLAEEIIGEDVYPVVGTMHEYSASFDGLTMGEDIAFEHKTLNDELRAAFDMIESIAPAYRDKVGGAELPLAYRIQMEQQCMVAGCSRVLFMASKWNGDELLEERHCWYQPDLVLRAEIGKGWIQFKKDLAAYVPAEVVAPVTAAPIESLPAVSVRMDGSIAVISNLDVFGAKLKAFVGAIDLQPSTDQAFANAEAAVKTLEKAQLALEQAESAALAEIAPVELMRRTVADYIELARTTRLTLEKVVKVRKEQIRQEIVQDGSQALAAHLEALNKRLGKNYMPAVRADFAGAIRGKRTVDSLRDAVDTTLANAKIEANAIADRIQVNLTLLRETAMNHVFLFADTAQIVLKANDDFATMVKARIDEHDKAEAARLEAQREKIRQEELARIECEQEAARQAAAKAEADKVAAAAAQERQIEAAKATAAEAARKAAEPAPAQNPLAQAATETVAVSAPAANVVPMRAAAPAPAAVTSTPPTLKLGSIADRLGFALSADFLRSLGFEPAAKVGAHGVYHEASFPLICAALVAHIEAVQSKQAA